jgi:hypothetical protein
MKESSHPRGPKLRRLAQCLQEEGQLAGRVAVQHDARLGDVDDISNSFANFSRTEIQIRRVEWRMNLFTN